MIYHTLQRYLGDITIYEAQFGKKKTNFMRKYIKSDTN